MKGLAQALIIASMQAFRFATPQSKITPAGYLQYLLSNNKPSVISNGIDDGSGYIRDLKIRYMQRGVAEGSTEDDCSVDVQSAYITTDVPATMFRKIGIAFEDDLIAKFERDALATMSVGTPAFNGVIKEVYDVILNYANGIFTKIDKDLQAVQAANFGVNVASGVNTARTVNFPLNGTNNDLYSGMTQVMGEAMQNEMMLNGASVVGSGIITNYMLQQRAKSADQAGVNTSLLALPEFRFDPFAQAGWGANNFGLFEKDAVQFINICRFRGAKAGQKGSDYFMTMRLPVQDSIGQGNVSSYEFDVQLTYRTCPSELQIGAVSDANPPVKLGRGWNVILMSSYQQFNIPVDSYNSADRMYGNNGTYLYHATNA